MASGGDVVMRLPNNMTDGAWYQAVVSIDRNNIRIQCEYSLNFEVAYIQSCNRSG